MQSTASTKSELERMLDAARRDKDAAEQRSHLLEENVASLKREIERLSSHRSSLGDELGSAVRLSRSPIRSILFCVQRVWIFENCENLCHFVYIQ